jgi:DNA processing protein
MDYSLRQLAPSEFPPLLREIPDPPKTLYLAGALPSPEQKFLAVVGSRKYSPYGKSVVETLIAGLAGYPVVVVSGLAFGIDALAHEAALQVKLGTIAVPGSGLDRSVLYPQAHVRLAERILEAGGALISEFEPTFRARPESFPQRNRIMAGLSHAVLMIEGAERSGTLITARLALDYNRDLLVVPGSIFSPNSFGTHLFLTLGATPITSPGDILHALHIEHRVPSRDERGDLSSEEQAVLRLLIEPLPRDELIVKLHLPTVETQILLSTMELKGLVTERLGKISAV